MTPEEFLDAQILEVARRIGAEAEFRTRLAMVDAKTRRGGR